MRLKETRLMLKRVESDSKIRYNSRSEVDGQYQSVLATPSPINDS